MQRIAPVFLNLTATNAVLGYFCQELLVCWKQIQDIILTGFHQDVGLVVGGGRRGVDRVGQILDLPGPAVLACGDSFGEIPGEIYNDENIRQIIGKYLNADNFSIFPL